MFEGGAMDEKLQRGVLTKRDCEELVKKVFCTAFPLSG